MEENNKQKKSFAKKFKTIIVLMIIIITLFLISNVYATSKGYPNIFFMIKEVVLGQEDQSASGKDNLLSDKDITISYSSIEIANGLKIQVQRIVLEENKSTLYIYINEPEGANEEYAKMPLTYMIYNAKGELISNSKGTEDGYRTYAIETTKPISETEKFKLEILNKDLNKLTTIEVDLANKELLVNGEVFEIEKLSEAELKKYLGIFCLFCVNNPNEVDNYNAKLIDMAIKMNEKILHMDDYTQAANVNNVNKMINSFFWEDIAPESGVLETSLFEYDEARQVYESRGINWGTGICLEITDISFNNGVYEVKFIYSINGSIFDQEIEELPKRETSVKLTLNDNSSLSKYKLVSIEYGVSLEDPASPEPDDAENDDIYGDNETGATNSLYSTVIHDYKAAMEDAGYNAVNYVNLNTTMLNYYHENPGTKFYYAFYDIDGDGQSECIIMTAVQHEFDVTFEAIDVYCIHNGIVERLIGNNSLGDSSHLTIYKNGKMYVESVENADSGVVSIYEKFPDGGSAIQSVANFYYLYDENGEIKIYMDPAYIRESWCKSLEEVFNNFVGSTEKVILDNLNMAEI